MVDVNSFLIMITFALCIVLLVFLIILVTKLISTVDRVNGILNEVDNKIAKIDRALRIVDVVTDNMALFSDKLVDVLSNVIRKLFYKKKNGKEDDNSEQ